MKKYLPFILIGVVVLALAVGGWFMVGNRGGGEMTTEEGGEMAVKGETEEMSVSGKLEDLLSLGKAVKCTWQDIENNTGEAWIKSDKIYTEMIQAGRKAYYLQRDDCTWMWQEGEAQGYKICVEPEEGEDGETELPEAFSMNTGTMQYNCIPQVINDTKFEAPTSVEFLDFAAMMQMGMPAGMGN